MAEARSNTVLAKVAADILGKRMSVSLRPKGRSMRPFIREGDTVVIEPAPASLRIGDVILFHHREGGLMLHRIIAISPEGFRTRGDALMTDDGIVSRTAVLGRARLIENRWSHHLHFPAGFLLVQALKLRQWPIIFRLMNILRSLAAGHLGFRRSEQRR